MIDISDRLRNKGVSPVIGVILMVALVIALIALVTVFLFDITGDQNEPADTTLNEENNEIIVLRNENVDAYYANGLPFPSNQPGTTVRPIPDKNGNVQVIGEVDGTNQVIQDFKVDPIQYDFSDGNININFDNGITELSAGEDVEWNFGSTGGDYTLYECAYYDGEIFTFTDNPSDSCSEYTGNPTDSIRFVGSYPLNGFSFITRSVDTGNLYSTGGFATQTNPTSTTTYTFTDDGNTDEDPLVGYDNQVVEFEFKDNSGNYQSVNWEVTEENGAGINRTAPNGVERFKAKLQLDNPDEQGNFLIESKDPSTGDTVDKKRVVVLPNETTEYTYSGDSTTDSNNNNDDSGQTVSGDTQINPPISNNAEVIAYSNGNIVDSTSTESDGSYTVQADSIDRIVLDINGFTSDELSYPLYGRASKSVGNGDSTVDFIFSTTESRLKDINNDGSDEYVVAEERPALVTEELPANWTDLTDSITSPYVANDESYTGSESIKSKNLTAGFDIGLDNYEYAKWSGVDDGDYVKNISFYWKESRQNTGHRWSLRSSNNETVASFATDNPQFMYYSPSNNRWLQFGTGEYDRWFKTTIRLDYSENSYDIIVKNTDTSETSKITGVEFENRLNTTQLSLHTFDKDYTARNVEVWTDNINVDIGTGKGANSEITDPNPTTDEGVLIDAFEDDDVSSWSVSDKTSKFRSSITRSYGGDSSLYVRSPDYYGIVDEYPKWASLEPKQFSGGTKPDKFIYYMNENSAQYGGGITLKSPDGKNVAGFYSDNPQWYVLTGDLSCCGDGTEKIYNGDGYERWIRVEMDFNWGDATTTYSVKDMSTGTTRTVTRDMPNFDDIEGVDITSFNTYSDDVRANMYIDNITYVPGDEKAYPDKPSVIGKTNTTASVESGVKSDLNGVDLRFKISNETFSRTVTAQSDVDLGDKNGDYTFSTQIDSLNKCTRYNVKAIAEDDTGKKYDTPVRDVYTDGCEGLEIGFESGSFGDRWTIDDNNFDVTDTYSYEGTYSAGIKTTSGTDGKRFAVANVAERNSPKKIEFYWREGLSSWGGGLVALNENGDTAAGFYSNNPQWEVITPNGINQIKGDDGVYDVWVKVTMEFDYANNEVTYSVVDQDSGKTRQTTVDMRTDSSDIDEIAIENHQRQRANMYMWFDSISVGETEN